MSLKFQSISIIIITDIKQTKYLEGNSANSDRKILEHINICFTFICDSELGAFINTLVVSPYITRKVNISILLAILNILFSRQVLRIKKYHQQRFCSDAPPNSQN